MMTHLDPRKQSPPVSDTGVQQNHHIANPVILNGLYSACVPAVFALLCLFIEFR